MTRARRLKWPVLSRLSWAWLTFASLCCGAIGYAVYDAGRQPAEVAMRVEGIERLAQPARRTADVASPERLSPVASAPHTEAIANGPKIISLNDGAESGDVSGVEYPDTDYIEPQSLEAEDMLAANVDSMIFRGDPADEVIITIDGAPARAPGEAARKPETKRAAQPVTIVASTDPSMLRKTAYGMAPKPGAGGRRPAGYYAKPFKPGESANVALIVGGLGLNRALTEKAIDDLPPNITLAFAPYAKDLPFWTKRARERGHEIMIELPMEDRTGAETALGPAALLTTRSAEENLQRLDWLLSRFDGYFGVTNYLGSKFSADAALDPVLKRIKESGLAYIDDTGAVRLTWHGEEDDIATVNRVISPGYESDKSQTLADLEALEKIAMRSGDAIGKTYAHSATLDAIVAWASSLEDRELMLAPASAVVALRASEL